MKTTTNRRKSFFSARKIAVLALMTALSYAVSFLEIPTPLFGASFLKLDFGNVFITLVAFLFGPIEGVAVCLIKESLRCLTSSSLCAGELANFLVTTSFLLLPSIAYRFQKHLKTVLITLPIACVFATGIALLANRFIIFPTYATLFGGSIFGMTVVEAFTAFFPALILFNAIKTISISLLTLLLYKRLSYLWKRYGE